jgi:membrane fusion protein, macrolide-specific efflux system
VRAPRRKRWRKRYWVTASVIVFIIILLVSFHKNPNGVIYSPVTLKRGDIHVSVLAVGYVAPENRLEIKPPISGRIEKVLAEEGQYVKKGQILLWMSSSERAALLDAARGQGPKEIKKWERLYKPTPVIAPIDGTIILRNVEAGQSFSNNDAVLVMSDRLTVKAQVDETDIAQIQLKERAEILLDAYPDTMIAGQVDLIGYEARTINSVTTYIVDVLPDHAPDVMRAGMTANVNFFIDSKQNVVLIPNEALKMRNGKTLTMVPNGSGDAIEKQITVGSSDGKQSEVIEGLKENDTVLIRQIHSDGQGSTLFEPLRGPRGGH